jgi:hypothetical protein
MRGFFVGGGETLILNGLKIREITVYRSITNQYRGFNPYRLVKGKKGVLTGRH